MGRCDYFEKECDNNSKCNECLNHSKPDMREKVKEYIIELNEEINRCDTWVKEHINNKSCDIAIMESRIETLIEVKNDLQGRLDEII